MNKSISRYLIPLLILLSACAPLIDSQEINTSETNTTAEVEAPQIEDQIEPPPPGADMEFDTDFSKKSISFDEILSGGPPKDGIPSIDIPDFVSTEDADEWLSPNEPVIQLILNSEAKAYPLQILMWHEIANDSIGNTPVVVTFCPLCNTAIVFKRVVGGREVDFGTTGRLRFSNLIMYDRQTESWWQQASGNAIVGEFTGTQLEFIPASIVAWKDFKDANPDGLVLSRDTGYSRAYGQNPYFGYDDINIPPFLYRGPETPGILPPTARVITLDLKGEVVAYPYEVLEDIRVVNDRVGDEDIVVLWSPGTTSALDSSNIAEGRDVGSAAIYSRNLDGRTLTFIFEEENIFDQETLSRWDVLGRAISGELEGSQLNEVVAINHFWFSWAAFKPETRVFQP